MSTFEENKQRKFLRNSALSSKKGRIKKQLNAHYCKVHVFLEGHKILRNIHPTLFLRSASQR